MQYKKFVLSIGDDGAQEAELNRFLRGGSWGDFATHCCSAIRFSNSTDYRHNCYGFRLVLSE